MLNDFIDENGALHCGAQARAIIPVVRDRLSTFRKNGDLVIFLQD
jgi:nicotinamidase-related amidase